METKCLVRSLTYFIPNAPEPTGTRPIADKLGSNADGSLDPYIQSHGLVANKEANWLPVDKRPFTLADAALLRRGPSPCGVLDAARGTTGKLRANSPKM